MSDKPRAWQNVNRQANIRTIHVYRNIYKEIVMSFSATASNKQDLHCSVGLTIKGHLVCTWVLSGVPRQQGWFPLNKDLDADSYIHGLSKTIWYSMVGECLQHGGGGAAKVDSLKEDLDIYIYYMYIFCFSKDATIEHKLVVIFTQDAMPCGHLWIVAGSWRQRTLHGQAPAPCQQPLQAFVWSNQLVLHSNALWRER